MTLGCLNFWYQIVFSVSKDKPISCDILEIVPQRLFSVPDKGKI